MRFEGLDLNLLVILDALLEEKSVTRASIRLNVSQPAVSAALAKLRWHTKDELLQKVGRSTQLTPRAEQMVNPVRNILIQIRATLKNENMFDPCSSERTFHIAMSSFAAHVITPALTKILIDHYPSIKYVVEPLSSDSIRRIKNNDIDICVSSDQLNLLNPRESVEDLTCAPFFSDSWVLISDAESYLVPDGMALNDFLSLPYVETHFGRETMTVVEDALAKSGITPNVVMMTPDFEITVKNVQNSSCVAIVPSLLIKGRNLSSLRTYDPPFKIPDLNESLLWHSRNDVEPGHQWFREILLEIGAAANI